MGTLYVVPTPIGNLEDITARALRVLREVELVAAEDTRHSRILLQHFGIRTRLTSYHQHAKHRGIKRILESLDYGDVALVSDAGMPSIADPGFELIRAAIECGYPVEVLPGASAVTTAIALAAIPARGFVCLGFLPRTRPELTARLREVAGLPHSLVLFEAPHRVVQTLTVIREVLGDRQMAALKELTKTHEQAIRGSISHVLETARGCEPKGEWTVVVGPGEHTASVPPDEEICRALVRLREDGESGRDAVRIVSEAFGLPRSHVYRVWLAIPASREAGHGRAADGRTAGRI